MAIDDQKLAEKLIEAEVAYIEAADREDDLRIQQTISETLRWYMASQKQQQEEAKAEAKQQEEAQEQWIEANESRIEELSDFMASSMDTDELVGYVQDFLRSNWIDFPPGLDEDWELYRAGRTYGTRGDGWDPIR